MKSKKLLIEKIKDIVTTTILEHNVIRIVEERGMFSDYKQLISPILNYINRYLDVDTDYTSFNLELKSGEKFKTRKYVYKIPNEFLKGLSWVENKQINITIIDVSKEDSLKIGVDDLKGVRSGFYSASKFDKLTSNGKLEDLKITLLGFSIDGQLLYENLQSSLYHEFTHAYENFKKLKRGGNLMQDMSLTNYAVVSKHNNEPFKFINYYLLNKTEFHANLAGVYGDLERIQSVRKNFSNDIKETNAYEYYIKIKDEYLPQIIKMGNEQWDVFKTQAFKKTIKYQDTEIFKNQFIKLVQIQLSDFFRGIGKVASQYYDDIEVKDDFKNKNIRL